MNKDDYKKCKRALFWLTELSIYPNDKNLDLVESKFLNIFGKVISELNVIFTLFYHSNKNARRKLLVKIAQIERKLCEIKQD